MTFKQPKDIIRKHEYSALTDKEITKQIKNKISSLNRRMKTLERSGYSDYSGSYTRITKWLDDEGIGKYFSSKKYKKASRDERIKYLVQLSHFNDYAIGVKKVKENLEREREKLSTDLNKTITTQQLLAIKDAMASWREFMGHEAGFEYKDFTSDESRKMFTERMTNLHNLDIFIEGLKYFGDRDYQYPIEDLEIYKTYFNFDLGIVIAYENNIAYNPLNNKVYDSSYMETDYTFDNNSGSIVDNSGESVDYYDILNGKI